MTSSVSVHEMVREVVVAEKEGLIDKKSGRNKDDNYKPRNCTIQFRP